MNDREEWLSELNNKKELMKEQMKERKKEIDK